MHEKEFKRRWRELNPFFSVCTCSCVKPKRWCYSIQASGKLSMRFLSPVRCESHLTSLHNRCTAAPSSLKEQTPPLRPLQMCMGVRVLYTPLVSWAGYRGDQCQGCFISLNAAAVGADLSPSLRGSSTKNRLFLSGVNRASVPRGSGSSLNTFTKKKKAIKINPSSWFHTGGISPANDPLCPLNLMDLMLS